MEQEAQCAALAAHEKQELLGLLRTLDVSIVQINPEEWQFVQERVGDGYKEVSSERYASEDQAILAAAENWSI